MSRNRPAEGNTRNQKQAWVFGSLARRTHHRREAPGDAPTKQSGQHGMEILMKTKTGQSETRVGEGGSGDEEGDQVVDKQYESESAALSSMPMPQVA